MLLREDEAAETFRFPDAREAQKISGAMATLRNATRDAVDTVLGDFVEQPAIHTTPSLDSHNYIRSVRTRALGEDKAGNIIDRVLRGDNITGIEGLESVDAPAVAELIQNEAISTPRRFH
jgi:flagellar motor switch protein FliG